MLSVTAFLLLRLVATWFVVDWISGFVHWLEDSYGHPFARFTGRRVTIPNLIHHARPRAFTQNSWYTSSQLLLFTCLAVVAIAWVIGRLSPMVVFGAFLGANANQVHKWSHRSPRENGPLVAVLQRLRVIQSPSHHQQHHMDMKHSHYCVLTDFLNPILDGTGFWRGLEFAIANIFGLRKRNDDEMLRLVLASDPDLLLRAGSSLEPAGRTTA